ncbi:protein-tyrosine phosphatase-like protein [Rhodofomes roseus]|uniref:protein-tyrosine-phosphatase n=1 Tax=Rhodofomes roseus TaxID=34475 RepID=A0ABQ8K7B7_9APHY|nr:protein-tyrosine phosphatase-like protein [Rhodofomes roseus]KAH9833155.1 protein-tyrosine phosphatase-like protein [Rhodofomes roseus]
MVKRQKAQKAQPAQPTEAVSLILPPALFLGPCSAASNKAFLSANTITHVLSIGSTPAQKVEGVIYHRLSLNDSPTSSISKATEEACKLIDGAIAVKAKSGGKGKILVHCSAGISRSPTLVVAYLMRSHNMPLKAALGQVVRARPQVSPNSGFLEQLKRFEEELFGSVSLDVDALPKREKDRLALFVDDESKSAGAEKSPQDG